ncbi:diguanylate cyclase [Streptomyces sp. H27-G5]|uniref:diguanylate cyclase domain-containing protein n=1 Tax=Streptomyces sp. H27-G5 TaxID=2996698 RepID=UPI00226E5B33|nr:diguanylate cyclase [Streptomyces sp. H27-G5]MCY0923975.1 diguanylate cyclase [Streptomyces sp. H27-G5]
MGHAAGDTVLASIGARLTARAGPRASGGRLGGDEFAIVLGLTSDRRARAWSSWSGCCKRRSLWTTAAPSTWPHRSALRSRPRLAPAT